jgi:glutaminyl-tRNA synthetase
MEHAVRADADANAPRCLAELRPLRVVITNLPEDHFVEVEAKVS